MKQELHFTDNKTYFGADIHRYGVKVDDLEKLLFFDTFVKYHEDKIFLTNGEDQYVPVIDWESFCYDYVMHGDYRNLS